MVQSIIGIVYILESIRDYIRIKIKVREDFKLANYTFCIFERTLRRTARQLEGKWVSDLFFPSLYLFETIFKLNCKKKQKIIVL